MSDTVSHMCGYCNNFFEGEHDMDKHIEDVHFLEVLNEEDEEDVEEDAMETLDVDINVDEVNQVSEEAEDMDNADVDINVDKINQVSEEDDFMDNTDVDVNQDKINQVSEEDEVMDNADVDVNQDKINQVSEEDEVMDNVDVDINVSNVNEDLEEYEVVDPVDVSLDFEENLDINVKKEFSPETSKLDHQEELKPKKANKHKKDKPLADINIKSETNDVGEKEKIQEAEMKKLRRREKDRLKKQRKRQRQVESGDIEMIRKKDKLKRQRVRQLKLTNEQLQSGPIDDNKPIDRLGRVRKVPKVPKEGSIPHRDWSSFYRREGDNVRCLGCMDEFGGLRQVEILSSF